MIGKAAILGLGARGQKWAETCQRAGWEVAGFDPDGRAGLSLSGVTWRRETTISAAVRAADWVICCLPDRLELMQMVIQRAQSEAPDRALVAVTSRGYDLEEVQSCALRPGKVFRVLEAKDGGLTLDVNARNDAEMRAAATATLAELAAVLSLDITPDVGIGQDESRKA